MRVLLALVVTLALAGGCSLATGPGSSVFEIRFSAPSVVSDTGIDVRTVIEVAGEVRTLTRPDFEPVGEGQLDALGLRIPTTGAGEVTCAVGRDGIWSEGTLTFEVEDGFRYGVACSVQSAPAGCFGCRGEESFDLDPTLGFAEDARLYMGWGGDPEDNPVNY